jgi:hypothetical protein
MKHVNADPLNMIGMNIPSIYGGILGDKYWESRHEDKLFDRKALKSSRVKVQGWETEDDQLFYESQSSGNEEEDETTKHA